MTTIDEVVEALQVVLTEVAAAAARQTGCVQREVKFSGATLVQTLVLGWLSDPDAPLSGLCHAADRLGVTLRPQALDQRFTPALADCLKLVLEAALTEVVSAAPTLAPLLARFTGVYVLDSTTITLPDTLAAVWPGCGGRVPQGSAAALKLQLELDLCAGTLRGSLHPGRAQDQTAPELDAPHPAGGVRLQDLGYFKLERLAAWDTAGLFYLSRLKSGVVITTTDGQRWETGRWLAQQRQPVVDQPVLVGSAQRLASRLLAVRVPPAVAAERRRLLRADAQREGTPLSRARLALADWTVLVTNLPADQLTVQEALVLARARWQIELLFKLWKDFGHLDRWRSGKPWRILAEVYAKLIGLIIQHWLLLTACWAAPDRSLRKAAAALRAELPALLWVWPLPQDLATTLTRLVPFLARVAGVNRRRRRPAAAQLWLDPSLQWTTSESPPLTTTHPASSLQEVA